MDVSVNIAQARNINGDIKEYCQRLVDQTSVLKSNLKTIENNWESTGQDKEEYVTQLNKQVSNINSLSQALNALYNVVENHLDELERISANQL